jgi:phosphohistidine phosphatase
MGEEWRSMLLYLLRHGAAEAAAKSGRDADRVLTNDGREKVRRVVRRAREGGMWPALILSSPFARALETAEVAAKALGYEDEIVTSNALIPDASPEEAWDEIRAHKDQSEVLVASHQPLCGALAAFLLNAPTLEIDFRKSALVCIDVDGAGARPKGVLQWMLTAKLA